jgi:hypothetical protein
MEDGVLVVAAGERTDNMTVAIALELIVLCFHLTVTAVAATA